MSPTLTNWFTNPGAPIPLPAFLVNLGLAALLGFLLGRLYVHFGQSLSNRSLFARNFMVLTMTTTLIISVVKSSLALSLGLVGALSIIRFRAAIKEPEELSFLFLAISVGLGLGAGQALVTVAALLAVAILLAVRHLGRKKADAPNLFLTLSAAGATRPTLPQLLEVLGQCCAAAELKRLDEGPERIEASFRAAFADPSRIDECSRRLRGLGEEVRISYLEERDFAA
ncbi:MAG: DUF4956 domain-containing protein [Verrucomicrobia bacterium]|nr:DUF4956 domain-containing protein [Verrucomicrobiota bacterium]